MNQLMNLERVRNVELVRRISKLRKNENATADDPDDEVTRAVAQHLRTSHRSELRRVLCEVRTGILTIRGQVSSYYMKQVAQEMVRAVSGVDRIVNHLEVVLAGKGERE